VNDDGVCGAADVDYGAAKDVYKMVGGGGARERGRGDVYRRERRERERRIQMRDYTDAGNAC
jgi:hypothetical protein